MVQHATAIDTTKTEEIRPGSIETIHEGQVGIMIQGYASVFNERDRDGDFMTRAGFKALADEWERPEDRRLLYNHGTDPKLGHRRIGQVLSHQITPTGLVVESFVPRDQPYRDREARARWRDVYDGIKAERIKGYSVEGNWRTDQRGGMYQCSVGELSICPFPAGKSTTFEIMGHGIKAAVNKALLERAQKDDDGPLHDAIVGSLLTPKPGVKHAPDDCGICLTRQLDLIQTIYLAKTLLHMDEQVYG